MAQYYENAYWETLSFQDKTQREAAREITVEQY
jgi:hypothetical protein